MALFDFLGDAAYARLCQVAEAARQETEAIREEKADSEHVEEDRILEGSRLTSEDVRAIRASDLSQSVLARQYGLTRSTISSIRRRRVWKDVE